VSYVAIGTQIYIFSWKKFNCVPELQYEVKEKYEPNLLGPPMPLLATLIVVSTRLRRFLRHQSVRAQKGFHSALFTAMLTPQEDLALECSAGLVEFANFVKPVAF
jgi:hypothetical protein